MTIKKFFIAHSWTDVGVNIQTKEVAKALSQKANVYFFTQARIGKPEINVSDHLKIMEWPSKRPNTLRDIIFLIKKIRREKPGALIVHFGATNICMITSWLMGVRYRIAWMHTLSGQYYLDSQNKVAADRNFFLRKLAYRFATHIIVLNEHGRKDAVERYKIHPGKISMIYNGIGKNNGPDYRAYGPQKSIRYSGRLDKSKGIDILIHAFAIVYKNNTDVILEIVGKGNEEDNIRKMIQDAGLEKAVKMHGYFNRYDESIKFISEAYCLVVPSRIDNFPTVILEAFASGTPVIASNVGGIPDMIENNREGLLVEPGSIDELASSIQKIVEDVPLRESMATQARNTFSEKFSMEKHVSNVIEFLERVSVKG